METIDFEKIVNRVVSLQGRPLEIRACPDQYLGKVAGFVEVPLTEGRTPAQKRTSEPCILLILESPHKEEFVGEPGPAKGFTGEMIKQHLGTVLGLPDLENYGLILVNAIQHQCSLGSNTTVYRDRIFRAVWSNGGAENFQNRIVSIFQVGDLIVNCCTKGNDFELYGPLRNLVEVALKASIPNTESLRRTHPSSWFEAKQRGKEWKV
jgi:hypothetical protein